MGNIIFFLSLLTFSTIRETHSNYVRVCYYPSWAKYRGHSESRMMISDIDVDLCTHLVYAFGGIDTKKVDLVAAEAAHDKPGGDFEQFNNLKSRNPNLKTMLSIGGQNAESSQFIAITKTGPYIQTFANRALKFLKQRRFDGLDVDWEYPNAQTKAKFVLLLKALREHFNADSAPQKKILTIASAAGTWKITPGYDIPGIARYVDFVNIMTYDYHVGGAEVAAFNSPLWSRPNFHHTLSTNWTIKHYMEKGLPASKTVLGLTWVGRRYVLQDRTKFTPGSKVTKTKRKGQWYEIEYGLAYPEICVMRARSGARDYWDEVQSVPYLVYQDNFVGYENHKSLKIKMKYLKNLHLRGFMLWSLDQDDFSGQVCNEGRNPLLKTANTALLTDDDEEKDKDDNGDGDGDGGDAGGDGDGGDDKDGDGDKNGDGDEKGDSNKKGDGNKTCDGNNNCGCEGIVCTQVNLPLVFISCLAAFMGFAFANQ